MPRIWRTSASRDSGTVVLLAFCCEKDDHGPPGTRLHTWSNGGILRSVSASKQEMSAVCRRVSKTHDIAHLESGVS